MLNGSHSVFWTILLMLALLLAVGAGGRVLTASHNATVATRGDCDRQRQKAQDDEQGADWGWNVFDNGSGSRIYRL